VRSGVAGEDGIGEDWNCPVMFGKAGEAWICRERKGEEWPGPVRQGRRGADGNGLGRSGAMSWGEAGEEWRGPARPGWVRCGEAGKASKIKLTGGY
jgi:hypothetical protein